MKIIGISGSLRKASYNTALLRALISSQPQGMEIEPIRLNSIPVYDGDDEKATGKPAAILDLDQKIRGSDGVIIVTPEYNFSIPGGLKNAIDWLSRGSSPLKGKRIGIMGASDGPIGTARSQYHLRQTLQSQEAIVMPRPEIFVSTAQEKFDAEGNLTDEATLKRLGKWLKAFVEWVEKRP
jgi:chromate reductase, NAD(P)H dehydrogenase (quinone)